MNGSRAKEMAEVRSNKPLRSEDAYRGLVFVDDSNDKLFLLNISHKIEKKIVEMNDSCKEQVYTIGELAFIFKEKLSNIHAFSKKKFNLESCYQAHFKKDIRRINEYCAAYTAYKHGGKKSLPITTNIVLGQLLNSKNEEKKNAAFEILKNQALPDGTPLSSVNVKNLSSKILIKTEFDIFLNIVDQTEVFTKKTNASISKAATFIYKTSIIPKDYETTNKISDLKNELNNATKDLDKILNILLERLSLSRQGKLHPDDDGLTEIAENDFQS